MICDYRHHKQEQHKVRLTVGGDRLIYNDGASSSTVSLLEKQLLLNSKISDASKGVRFMTLDIKDCSFKKLWNDQNTCEYILNIFLKI